MAGYELGGGPTNPFNNQYKITGGTQLPPAVLAGGPVQEQQAKALQQYSTNAPSKLGGFVGKFGSFGVGAQIGDALSGLGSTIGNKYGEDFSDEQKAMQSSIRKIGASFGPIGQIISAATGAVDAIGTATGLNLSNIDKNSANRAGIGGAAGFNNVMNMLPGNSMLWGWMGGSRTNGYKMSDDAEEMQAGYSGTVGDLRAAGDIANKRLLFGKRKANDFIDEARRNDMLLAQINETNTMRKQSDYYQDLQHQNINRYAGQNYLGVRVGKQGTKLMSIEQVRAIIQSNHQKETEKLQNGGIIGVDTNILPEGALHARKNGLADLNPELEDATKKGIPVMAVEGEQVQQQVAEIEHSEIIFRLEVTQRLEELRKDGSEEAMIEAGKLVTEELIENTQDNIGMITEEVENDK